ncbi:MAG: hypothetical protein ACTSW1_10575 [Candidatus Hodarchaeales archaeon]
MVSYESEWVQFLANLEHTRKETVKFHGDKFFNLCERYFNESLQKKLKMEKKFRDHSSKSHDSILYLRLAQYHWDDLHIIAIYISSGLYSQSIRELRFLLESFAQGYYLDNHHTLKTLQQKIDWLKSQSLFGHKLFEKAFNRQKKRISQFDSTYGALSNFVHSSHQELKKFIHSNSRRILSGAIVSYQEEQFNKCIDLWNRVHYLILNLIMDGC